MIAGARSGVPARTSPRQAIVVDAGGLQPPAATRKGHRAPSWSDDVRRAVVLDLLGSLVGVNGATISVLAAGPTHARTIVALVPPGIDLLIPPRDAAARDGRLLWALDQHLQRAFSRVVAIAADVPALPARTVATALSTLSSADVVAGPAFGSGFYLFGVRDRLGLEIATAAGAATGFDGLTTAALAAAIGARDAVLRSVERRGRLGDEVRIDQVRAAVTAAPSAAPRTAALLRTLIDSDDLPPTVPPGAGGIAHDFARGADR
jgi:hypothetical protein